MADVHDTTVEAIVLGMGPGGEEVAGRLAAAGMRVIGIDDRLVGGECANYGCVPTKMMVRAADLVAEANRVDGTAGAASVTPDWSPVATRIREATDDWDDTAAVERFERKGGTFVRGRGRITATDTVTVGDDTYRATEALVVATGTVPAVPPIDGLADTPFWTNRDVVRAEQVPASLVVLGGGAIGCELVQVFRRFGSQVAVVEAADRLLPSEEPDAGERLAAVLAREGVTVVTATKATHVGHDGAFSITLEDGRELRADRLLVATGREVDLAGIGADALGVDLGDGRALPTDEDLRVTDRVWAVGDVTGKGAFTHVATYQGRLAAADILGDAHPPADHTAVPRVTFTDPEVGSVGLTVAAARERGIDVAIGRTDVDTTARGWMHGPGNDGFIQLVADRSAGVLIGATSMGPVGGEVLGLLTLAVHARVPVDELRWMIYAYPTFHRGVEDALRDLA
jgi:pyruvate/2-oxoglutarate dehydrogenase complex dihydrolipoamide dehydrogenase (E3) component